MCCSEQRIEGVHTQKTGIVLPSNYVTNYGRILGSVFFDSVYFSNNMILGCVGSISKRCFRYTLFYACSSTAKGGGGSIKNRKPIGKIGVCESRMAERTH